MINHTPNSGKHTYICIIYVCKQRQDYKKHKHTANQKDLSRTREAKSMLDEH